MVADGTAGGDGEAFPLLKGKANPNGRIDITDAILILRKALDPAGSYW